jgi:Big-like domain-containing protein
VSAPVVVSVEPGNAETDVILGTPIFVTFDQEIDATTITDATFCLTGPGTSRNNLVSPSCRQRNPTRAPAAPAASSRCFVSGSAFSLLSDASACLASANESGRMLPARLSFLGTPSPDKPARWKLLFTDMFWGNLRLLLFLAGKDDGYALSALLCPPLSSGILCSARPPPPAAPISPNLCPRPTPVYPKTVRVQKLTPETRGNRIPPK